MTRLIAKICYWLQLHRLFYFLNRRRKRILTFHHVLPDELFLAGVANGVSCDVSTFRKILSEVKKFFSFSVDITDVRRATITFDDGYWDQYAVAAPILREQGIPAILFASGQLMRADGEETALTVDLLLHWISYVPLTAPLTLRLRVDEKCFQEELRNDNRADVWERAIWPAFLCDAARKGAGVLSQLERIYPLQCILEALPPAYIQLRLKGISPAQLHELLKAGWQIGWHTLSHYPLAKLSCEDAKAELTPIKNFPFCSTFSYPYGSGECVSRRDLELAERCGFKHAVSCTHEPTELGLDAERYFMPRMILPGDVALLHFELSGLKHFLKFRRLLPKV